MSIVATTASGVSGPAEDFVARQERVWVARARRGDRTAFGALVRRHQEPVRGLLLRLCRNASEADDLAQETFIRAYRGLAAFQGRSRFGTWLHRIAYNLYLNHRTRTRRHEALPEDFDRGVSPEQELGIDQAERAERVTAAVQGLPDRYRSVVALYYLQGVSYPEIASMLKMPLGTVKTQLHRAKAILRRRLGNDGLYASA